MGRLDADVGETRAPRLEEGGDLADSYLKGYGDRESTLFRGDISHTKISEHLASHRSATPALCTCTARLCDLIKRSDCLCVLACLFPMALL